MTTPVSKVAAGYLNTKQLQPAGKSDELASALSGSFSQLMQQAASNQGSLDKSTSNTLNSTGAASDVKGVAAQAEELRRKVESSKQNVADNSSKPDEDYGRGQEIGNGAREDQSIQDKFNDGSVGSEKSQNADGSSRGVRNATQKEEGIDEKAAELGMTQVVDLIAGKLGVTPEEVASALEVLGIDIRDIMEGDNLKTLVLMLSGNQSAADFLTDAELFNALNELQQEIPDIMDSDPQILDAAVIQENAADISGEISNSDPGVIAEAVEDSIADVPVADAGINTSDAAVDTAIVQGPAGTEAQVPADEASEQGTAEAAEILEGGETEETVEKKPVEEQSYRDVQNDTKSEVGDAPDTSTITVKTVVNQKNTGEDGQGSNQNMSDNSFLSPFERAAEIAREMDAPAGTQYTSGVDAQDIMRQITEGIRVNISQEVSRVEMHLNPESLGKLTISLMARENGVTAQFIAQNEAVKAAIESQAVQLQQRLEDAGVKVEAVEVTVASHEFEENLHQQFGQNGQNEENSEGQRSSRRRRNIDLSDIDSLFADENADEADLVDAEMMIANGGTVDYRA